MTAFGVGSQGLRMSVCGLVSGVLVSERESGLGPGGSNLVDPGRTGLGPSVSLDLNRNVPKDRLVGVGYNLELSRFHSPYERTKGTHRTLTY